MISELSVTVPDVAGELNRVLSVFAEEKINLLAFSINQVMPYSIIRLICSDPDNAFTKLAERAYVVERHDIFALKLINKYGELKRVTDALALKRININYGYLTVINGSDQAIILINTNDNNNASLVFKDLNVPDFCLVNGIFSE